MPRTLEFKEVNGALWAKLGKVPEEFPPDDGGYVYLYTREEVEAAKASAIRTFCFALANAYIEGRLDALSRPTSID